MQLTHNNIRRIFYDGTLQYKNQPIEYEGSFRYIGRYNNRGGAGIDTQLLTPESHQKMG